MPSYCIPNYSASRKWSSKALKTQTPFSFFFLQFVKLLRSLMHCSIFVFSDKTLKYDDAHMHFRSSFKALMEHLRDFGCKQYKGLKTTNLTQKGEQICFCIYCAAKQSNMSFLLERLGLIYVQKMLAMLSTQKVKRRIYLSVMIYWTDKTVYKWR